MYDIRPLIRALDDRIRYLLCTPDENNAEEMKALLNLLKEYDPATAAMPAGTGDRDIHITGKTVAGMTALATCLAVLTLLALSGQEEP